MTTYLIKRTSSIHKFSLMQKDKSHEHSNRKLQAGSGGLADIYDDADTIALYMLTATDAVRLTDEFVGLS